jgi:hypothetical protein
VRHHIDDDARLFRIDLNSGVSAGQALDQALVVLADRPDLWGWDWIVDARITPDDASFNQIARLARAYQVRPEIEVLTILVSHDSHLHLWARVMDFQFPRRRHRVVATPEAALVRIGADRAQRR